MSYRVVIADDEPFIVRGLKKIIDWGAAGMEIVGEARNGDSLARLIEELKPDILLSDICMPRKTGIEILKLIAISGARTKVIFFSGHREFAFAKEALSYGAVDYLLKPINVEELRRALRKAVSLLEGREASSGEAEGSRGGLADFGAPPRPGMDEIALGLAKPAPGRESSGHGDAAETASGGEAACPGEPGGSLYYTAFALREEEDEGGGGRLLKVAAMRIARRLVGEAGRGAVTEKEDLIAIVLEHENGFDLEGFAEKVRGAILAEIGLSIRISKGTREGNASGIPSSFESAIEGLLPSVPDAIRNARTGNDPLTRVKEYIEGHYGETVSLESAASVACMNPYYFSAYFKRRTGTNFKDYLAKVRIEGARRLLLRTDMRTFEVANAVGFKDPRRFAELFKERYGKTPGEYRKAIMGRG